MSDCEINDINQCSGTLDFEELEKKAIKLAAFSVSAATAGNTIVIFTMLALQELLEQLLLNPIANLSSITPVANSIAALNLSIRIVP